ncbi:TetR/AcrR family transcriptional regulator [Desulfotalea psychrophila]|nr:TetR/AcrR family transcriptional regulator [Desulfotalea psychrophila]
MMSVKNKKRGRPLKMGGKLSSEAIVESAVRLLEQSGKVPSIRKIASTLDVDPMAIYYYYSNKTAILEAVTVDLMESIYEPDGHKSWRDELLCLSVSYLRLLQDYAGLLETMLAMSDVSPAKIFISRFEEILSPLNLPEPDKKDAMDLLVDYLHGFALAARCNDGNKSLTVDVARGPITFYLDALGGKANLKDVKISR